MENFFRFHFLGTDSETAPGEMSVAMILIENEMIFVIVHRDTIHSKLSIFCNENVFVVVKSMVCQACYTVIFMALIRRFQSPKNKGNF